MLQLNPGYKLKPEQVAAIVNLVAASVPQLKPEDVSVVDQHGALLSRGIGAWSGPSQNWEVVDDYQQKAVANIEQVLAPILGNDNYRISVAADIDFSQKEETFQAYGEAPRMRSEVLREETTLDQLALGVPGSLSNRPAPTPADPKATDPKTANTAEALKSENKAATSTRNESTRNNDFDQSVTHIKYPAFALRQQSVAVVLNAANAPEGGWTDKARSDLEAMIKSAVGFNEKRGDSVTLSVFAFTAGELAPAEELPWWEKDAVLALIKLGVFGLISLLLLLMVVRPVVRNLTQRTQLPALPDASDPDLMLAREGERRMHLSPTPRADDALHGINILGELNPLSEIRLPAPGSGLEMQVEHLQMLAKNDPERVSEVIKHWIGRNDRDLKPA